MIFTKIEGGRKAMKKMLRRAASVLLAFAIAAAMGTPMQLRAETVIPGQAAVATETFLKEQESTVSSQEKTASENETESDEQAKPEDTGSSESGVKPEDTNASEGPTTPEDGNSSDEQAAPRQESVSENTTEPEQETVSENTLPNTEEAEGILQFNQNSTYAIVAQSSNLAMNRVVIGWTDFIKAATAYDENTNKLADEQAVFYIESGEFSDITIPDMITLNQNEVKVRITCRSNGEEYPVFTESGKGAAFVDPNKRLTDKEAVHIVEKTGDNEGIIRAASDGRYATIADDANGKPELKFLAETTKDQAEKFRFIENPKVLDTTIRLEHKATGKYIKTYQENGTPLTVDGNADETGISFSNAVFDTNSVDTVDGLTFVTASLVSKDYGNGVGSVFWADGQKAEEVKSNEKVNGNGWETLRILGNGDGTVSFKDSCFDQYITVKDGKLMCGRLPRETTKEELTDNEKFILHTETTPLPAENLKFDAGSRTQTTVDLSWENPKSLFTGIEIWQKKASESDEAYQKTGEAGGEEQYTVTGLEKDTEYHFKIRPVLVNGSGEDSESLYGGYSDVITVKTRVLEKPKTPENIRIEERDGKVILSWDAVENITGYRIYKASGMFSECTQTGAEIPAVIHNPSEETVENTPPPVIEAGKTEDTDPDTESKTGQTYSATEKAESIGTALAAAVRAGRVETELEPGEDQYSYYRVTAVRTDEGTEESDLSDAVSLETVIFGDHTIFLSPDDDAQEVDRLLKDLFDKQNNYGADAQFKGEQWQVYFKPGDYTETSCMYLGFYTSFNGLGKTPYDVKLNNIAIPAYLPGGSLGGGENNATCNFWRSAENLSVMNTRNEQGTAGYGSWRPDAFNWAVAQAAPLRRVYSERPVHYDWNYGWASGGYVADCLIAGAGENGDSAGTWSGQQFFTRNTKVQGNTFGTTLNNFFMGVEAANNLNSDTGKALRKGNGYTNWGIRGATSETDQVGGQQVVTEITNTPKISEKPFLYLDNGEYRIFVPAVRENARGISWGEGKANDGMGEGTSLPLDAFYIAKPTDTAEKINQQIAAGKNIYFTPGTYHAETPIVVDRKNAILLGTGMASIIPDNGEMALRVGDHDGIRIEGLIFDAGASSRLLLQVGTEGTHTNHSGNPIILQDLFFRVGGTTDVLTKADDALEINSDDVIGDHFWIWRADHGAGVEWYGNESKHGLIVNGDRVKCYALFNEHFQEYHTLWNGEDGETYFYQNETCYDPISQEAWMSHNGTVKGYSSYKVSNDVENHYATGLGVYNVFIYTGKTYDGKGIGIQLDNAIEVPNKPGVMVENACTQTFANDEKDGGGFYPLSSINHIINGIGGIVSSGMSEDLVRGEGWSRKFVLYYHNGEAEYGREPDRSTFVYDRTDPYDQRGKFIGTETVTVDAPTDEEIYLDRIKKLYSQYSDKTAHDYTANSWKRANMADVLENARIAISDGESAQAEIAEGKKYSQAQISALQTRINKACTTLEAAGEKLVYVGEAAWQQQKYRDYQKDNYMAAGWAAFESARTALDQVLEKAEKADPATTKDIYLLQTEIDDASKALQAAALELKPVRDIAVTGVALNRESLSLRVGNTFQLLVVMEPADATNQRVTWKSSDEKKVSVDQSGKVTAIAAGTAQITVTTTDGEYTAVCRVSVINGDEKESPVISEMPADKAVAGSDIVLSFIKTGNEDYRNAISDILVDEKEIGKSDYQIDENAGIGQNDTYTITLNKSLFPVTDDRQTFSIEVRAPQYENNRILQTIYQESRWSSTWLEEFDGNSLDASKWSYQNGTGAEYGIDGWGNNEQQYYTDDNLKVEDGELVITAKKEEKDGKPYTSARIWTMEDEKTAKFSQTYGRMEAKMKLAGGSGYEGIWPAFWMLPVEKHYGEWPLSGEIDILEVRGREPDKVNATLHFGKPWPDNVHEGGQFQFSTSKYNKGSDINDYHVYAVEWDPDEIRWYVDGECYYKYSDWYSQSSDDGERQPYPAPFDRDFYIVLNMAVGGDFDGGNLPDGKKLPVDMKVDYVRVYESKDGTQPGPDGPDDPKPTPGTTDKEKLLELIRGCETLNRNDYTEESWENYEKALEEAKAVASDEKAAQDDVDNAVTKLSEAVGNLMDREGLWAFDIADTSYTGKAIKPSVTVYHGKTLLTPGKDYTVSYKNNTKATDEAKVVIKGKGNYRGSIIQNFKILPIDLNGEDVLIPDLYVKAPKAGKSVTPAPVVTRNGKKLSKSKDFALGAVTVWDEEAKRVDRVTEPGEYNVEITGKGNYTGTRSVTMTVLDSDQILMSAVKVSGIRNTEYTGEAATPEFTVKYGGDTLILNQDYRVVCNNKEIGTATAIIKGIGGKYVGEKTIAFKITGTTLKAGDVTLDFTSKAYTGNPVEPAVNVSGAERNQDYTVSYDKNVKPGTAIVTVKGIGKYTGTVKKSFKITPFDIRSNEGGMLSWNKESLTAPYAKGGSKLNASDLDITFNGRRLTENVDYTLVYAANKAIGTANVRIRGKGSFKGTTAPVSFTVTERDLTDLADLSARDLLLKNAGRYRSVIPVIRDSDGKALKNGTDFKVVGYAGKDGAELSGTPAVGDEIRITVNGMGGYKGTVYVPFRIIENNRDISKAKVKVEAQVYTGKAIELSQFDSSGKQQITVTMKIDGTTQNLTEGVDFEIVKAGYSKNINKGSGRLTLRGIGRYGGTKTASFKINSHDFNNMKWYENLYSRAMSWFHGIR